MKFRAKLNQLGFTLIELLVVIAIIGLLSSVVLMALNTARVKSRDVKRKADVAQIQKALELYYNDYNQYPASGGAISPNGGWSNSADTSWTTLENLLKPYASRLPKDPQENNNTAEWGASAYHYSYYSLGYGCSQQWYMIVYQLETADGPDPTVRACDGAVFQYGGAGASVKVKTVGVSK